MVIELLVYFFDTMSLRIELVSALKRLLKARGVTYRELAAEIGLSEAAVKRMFSAQAIRLERLEQICEAIDVTLSDLATEARRGINTLSELDEAVEKRLVGNLPLLLALHLTQSRWTEQEVLSHYRFTKPQWTRLLVQLDRMGIIELLPDNRYRLRTARNFRWRRGGPMERFLLERLPAEFLDRPFSEANECLVLLNGMVSKASAEKITRRLNEAAEEFGNLLIQDASHSFEDKIGVSIVLAERPWSSLRLFDAWRVA